MTAFYIFGLVITRSLARDCIACPSMIKTTMAGFVIRVVSTHLVQASLVQASRLPAGRQAWTFFPSSQNCLNYDLYPEMIDRIIKYTLFRICNPEVEI
jgi:hypothetical protein